MFDTIRENRKKDKEEWRKSQCDVACKGLIRFSAQLSSTLESNDKIDNAFFGINLTMNPMPGEKAEDYLPPNIIEDVKNVNQAWRELISACNHLIMECQ